MKKIIIFIIILLIYLPSVKAQRGCCSHHGGVAGCGSNGRQICNDGTYSPTCTCSGATNNNSSSNYYKKNYIYGCTDPNANNYNSNANIDNGSCTYTIYGCTDPKADNYNNKANASDNSCKYTRFGCTNEQAINYNKNANISDHSCQFEKELIKTKKIKYKITYKENTNLNYKEKKVKQNGKYGKKQIKYKIITDENNIELSKNIIEERIIKKPKNKIVDRNTTKKKTIIDILFK